MVTPSKQTSVFPMSCTVAMVDLKHKIIKAKKTSLNFQETMLFGIFLLEDLDEAVNY